MPMMMILIIDFWPKILLTTDFTADWILRTSDKWYFLLTDCRPKILFTTD